MSGPISTPLTTSVAAGQAGHAGLHNEERGAINTLNTAIGGLLDTQAADITTTVAGAASAGAIGKAADAGHQHPLGVHTHQDATNGGLLGLAALTATGTRDATTYLRGDNTWAPPTATRITHGAVANTLRPIVPAGTVVEWYGTVAPANAITNDLWYDQNTGVDLWKRWNGTAWVVGGGSNGIAAGVAIIVCRNGANDPWTLGATAVQADFTAIRAAGGIVQFQSPDAAKPTIGSGSSQQNRWDSWIQFPVGQFDPTTIAGLLYYWNPNVITAADGSAVSSLAASFGTVALVQATVARQPSIQTVGGQRVVRFAPDGTAADDDELLATITAAAQPVTVIAVHSIGGTGAQQILDGGVQILTSTTQLQAYAGSTLSKTLTLPDALGVTAVVYNGASTKIYRNGGAPTTGTAGTSGLNTTFRLGRSGSAGRPLTGDIGAVMVYSGALTSAQIDSAGSQLAAQYPTASAWTAVTG